MGSNRLAVTDLDPSARAVLAGLSLPSVGPATVRTYLSTTALTALSDPGVHGQLGPLFAKFTEGEQSSAWRRAEEILGRCKELDIHVLTVRDAEYPVRLGRIKDFPPVLFVRGAYQRLQGLHVAVVGTREASQAGIGYATRLARELVGMGLGIVSGLALGIDTAAHEGALKGRGFTVAVMAHGLHMVSPGSNKGLAQRILDQGGVLLSEHPPDTPPRRSEFVRRNRIQSGMSIASVVVESGASGGAMHQARFTVEQGHRLFTFVPPSGAPGYSDFNMEGAHRLTAELGATAISSLQDLVAAVESLHIGHGPTRG